MQCKIRRCKACSFIPGLGYLLRVCRHGAGARMCIFETVCSEGHHWHIIGSRPSSELIVWAMRQNIATEEEPSDQQVKTRASRAWWYVHVIYKIVQAVLPQPDCVWKPRLYKYVVLWNCLQFHWGMLGPAPQSGRQRNHNNRNKSSALWRAVMNSAAISILTNMGSFASWTGHAIM